MGNTKPAPSSPDSPADASAAHSEDRLAAASVLRAEAQAVLNVVEHMDEAFDRAVDLILNCRGNVIVSGMGKSGIIGQKISATLASTGTPSHFLHPTEAMHGDLGRIRSDDLLILLSYGGETEDVLALAAVVRQDAVTTIAITRNGDSHLGRLCTACLHLGDVTEACPHNLAPTASTTAMLALGDALALAVSRRRAFSPDDFAKRHPGGMLGRQMMNITEILRHRAGENLPLIDQDSILGDVLRTTSTGGRRVGAVVLVDDQQRLAGLFTDADLARLLVREGPEALKRPMHEIMTTQPSHLSHRALVRDAVQMMRERRFDEIPIVDDDGRPVGLVDVQDLIALKVIAD
jgi:arabinose-5-phosphate isomerase